MARCGVWGKKWGFWYCPVDHGELDPELEAMTRGSVFGSIIRLVGGYEPDDRTWSRTRSSAMLSKNNFEVGWAHMASPTTSDGLDLVNRIALELPEIAAASYGPDLAAALRDRAWVEEAYSGFKRRGTESPTEDGTLLQALVDGWVIASKYGPVQRLYAEVWFDEYVREALAAMERRGWRDKRTLAALARLYNSSNTWGNRLANHPSSSEAEARNDVLHRYKTPSEGGKTHHADDVRAIQRWPDFEGELTRAPSVDDLHITDSLSLGGESAWVYGAVLVAGVAGLAWIGAGVAGALWWRRRGGRRR